MGTRNPGGRWRGLEVQVEGGVVQVERGAN